MKYIHIVIALIGFVAIVTGPWWIPLIVMIVLSLRWTALEVALMGILMDFTWQGSGAFAITSWHTWPLFTLLGLALPIGPASLRHRFLF